MPFYIPNHFTDRSLETRCCSEKLISRLQGTGCCLSERGKLLRWHSKLVPFPGRHALNQFLSYEFINMYRIIYVKVKYLTHKMDTSSKCLKLLISTRSFSGFWIYLFCGYHKVPIRCPDMLFKVCRLELHTIWSKWKYRYPCTVKKSWYQRYRLCFLRQSCLAVFIQLCECCVKQESSWTLRSKSLYHVQQKTV